MGRDNNNAGIHMVPRNYKGRTDVIDGFDRYAAIIAEESVKKNNQKDSLLSEVELCNFVSIIEKRGERSECLCGGELKYVDKLKIRFRYNKQMMSIDISGKQCRDCERKLVVKDEVLRPILHVMSSSN